MNENIQINKIVNKIFFPSGLARRGERTFSPPPWIHKWHMHRLGPKDPLMIIKNI